MPRKPKNVEQTTTVTSISLNDDFDTPLLIIALKHEITRAKHFARICKDEKKRLFHRTVERTYQQLLDAIQSA